MCQLGSVRELLMWGTVLGVRIGSTGEVGGERGRVVLGGGGGGGERWVGALGGGSDGGCGGTAEEGSAREEEDEHCGRSKEEIRMSLCWVKEKRMGKRG